MGLFLSFDWKTKTKRQNTYMHTEGPAVGDLAKEDKMNEKSGDYHCSSTIVDGCLGLKDLFQEMPNSKNNYECKMKEEVGCTCNQETETENLEDLDHLGIASLFEEEPLEIIELFSLNDLFNEENEPSIVYAFGLTMHPSLIPDSNKAQQDMSLVKFTLFDSEDDEEEHYSTSASLSSSKKAQVSPQKTNNCEDIHKILSSDKFISQLDRMKALNIQVQEEDGIEDKCVICMCEMENKHTLHKCSHEFCKECIDQHFQVKKTCPICGTAYGKITGNQPDGTMSVGIVGGNLPGYTNCRVIAVSYSFPDGVQNKTHPNPGVKFYGTYRIGYFPDNEEGRKVVRMLKVAFNRKLVFTVGRSRTTGQDNVVTWNDIHHKTSFSGGFHNFGYPDPSYLSRVQEELAAKGVTYDDLHEIPPLTL